MTRVKDDPAGLMRRLLAEAIGTGLLVTVVVGSGIAAERLSPQDMGLQLLENSTATVVGLAVLILMFGPVSGAHFNPVVTVADWLLSRPSGTGLPGSSVGLCLVAQVVGGIAGAVLANVMFDLPAVQISGTERATSGHGIGEIVATAGLVALIFLLARDRAARPVRGGGRRLHRRRLLVRLLDLVREPRCDGWPDLLRHLRRDRAFVGSALRRRADHRCRHRCGSCRRAVPGQQHSPGHGICWA